MGEIDEGAWVSVVQSAVNRYPVIPFEEIEFSRSVSSAVVTAIDT